jgi:hypothetical protein
VDAPLAVRGVAVVVAAVLAALPCLIEADDPVAHTLDALAGEVDEPGKATLLAGAELRRQVVDTRLDRPTSRTVRRTWRALIRLAEARVHVQRVRTGPAGPPGRTPAVLSPSDAVLAVLDQRLGDHVGALVRAYRAMHAARAAGLSLDDTALRTAERAGDAFEDASHAIIDLHS